MKPLELISRLRELGIRISVSGGELELDAPAGALNDELLEQVRQSKPELIRLLSWSRRSEHSLQQELRPVDREQKLPLSWAQQRLWFLDQLEPGSSAYNISWTVRLRGELHRAALQQALNNLVERHESLRTCFPQETGVPYQKVLDPTHLPIETLSLEGAADEKVRTRLARLASEPFNLETGPVIRVHLLRLAESEHILLVVIHHIVADGASMRILFRELAAYYESGLEGRPRSLEPLPLQYADFAVWQRNWLDGEELERQTEYWSRQLAGLPPLLELPWDRPRSAAMRYRGASVLRVLPAGLADQLRSLGREQGCTLFMVMLAAFYVLLMRYSGRTDLVVGTPMGGRPRSDLEGLIGFFINTVVLRADLQGDPAFTDLLSAVRDVALDAHANQELPFEKLVEVLQPERELSYSPVFQVMFDLQEEPRWRLPVNKLEVIPEVVFSSRTSSFDLTLSVRQAESGLDAMFEYDTDLFDEATIERMARHYQTLLEAIVADRQTTISRLPLLPQTEKDELVSSWSDLSATYPEALTLAAIFERQVISVPDAIAVIAGEDQCSYGELNRRANRLSYRLQAVAIGPGDTVAICVQRSLQNLAAVLGVLKTGACVVPLDPDYPQERLQQMVTGARADLLLSDENQAHKFADLEAETCRVFPLSEDWFVSPDYPDENPQLPVGPESIAFILFTSGSTGQPKAVELEHRGLLNYIYQLGRKTEVSQADRILQFASLSFDISIEETFTALLHGATLVLREDGMQSSTDDFVAGCERCEISWLSIPTAWWHELCSSADRLPAGLRSVVIGGEKAELEAFRCWSRLNEAGVRLFNTYGPTETSIVATWCELTHLDPSISRELPIGSPVPNVQAWVLDEHMQVLPVGVPGELYIGGAGVARGYRNHPELSERLFVPDPFRDSSAARLYRTGDRARYLPDGRLVFMGRVDDQVKVRGHRIEPGEVEAALLGINGVERCAVILKDERLVAYVVGSPEPSTLRDELKTLLPDYMVPGAFVQLDELPLTPNGKLDRHALPTPVMVRDESAEYVAPRTETEAQLVRIWQDVLGLDAAIGVHDDFFALGGHSLLATRVVARLRDEFGQGLPLRALFNEPTVAGLAALLAEGEGTDGGVALVPRAGDELPPLSWAQQRLWFLDQLEPDSAAYNLPWTARLTGRIDTDALQQALSALVVRHETLRTTIGVRAGEPVQLITDAQPVQLQTESMAAATDDDLDKRLAELAALPFDLSTGPLLRVHLLRVSDEDAILLLVMHHIVSDGWSMGVLFRELAALYDAAMKDAPAGLPELPVQYADYAVWQRQWLSGAELERQTGYWSQQLAGAPVLLELPLDHPRPPVQRYRGAWVNRTLSPELLSGLRELATREGCTLFMVLLTAFKVLLARHTGMEDIVVGTPIAGRKRTELEGLIGFFLNTLALRTDLGGNPGFRELLQRVRGTTLDAYDHQELPFEKLLEVLQPERSTAHSPVVQVMFNLHNEPSSGLSLAGLEVNPFTVDRGTAKFDLSVALVESSAGLQAGFEYNTDLFENETVDLLLRHYEELLWAFVHQRDAGVGSISLTSAMQAPVPQVSFAPFPEETTTLCDRFTEIAKTFPDRNALQAGKESCSYLELDRRSNAVAWQLEGLAGERVGLLLGQDVTMLTGLLGSLKAGCAYVPLDPELPATRLQTIVAEAELSVILTDTAHSPLLDVDSVQQLIIDGSGRDTAPSVKTAPDDLAYILFTSGSTGKPKGVMQSHRNVLHHVGVYSNALHLHSEDRLTLLPNFGFDAAVMDIFGALLNGACLFPMRLRDEEYTGELLDRIGEHRITVLHATPTVFRHLMRNKVCRHDLTCVRLVVLGGEETTAEDFASFRKQFAPPTLFVNGLGPSESTLALQFFADHSTRLPGNAVPVGTPVKGVEVELVNDDGSKAGICGELVLRSRFVSTGYWQQPELTRERFIADPDEPGVFCYRTGDRARYLPDGRLVFMGRVDDQVKVRGHRIEPGEVEAALLGINGVERCAVILKDERLVAYVVGSPEPSTLRDELKTLLPDYMVPGAFVQLDELPLTPNGKLDRHALPTPVMVRDESAEYVAPRTETEAQLVRIWQDVLGLDAAIGVHDDFFALGGHSLLAAQLVARVTDSLRVGLPIRRLFDTPTIAGIAEHVETLQWAISADQQSD